MVELLDLAQSLYNKLSTEKDNKKWIKLIEEALYRAYSLGFGVINYRIDEKYPIREIKKK